MTPREAFGGKVIDLYVCEYKSTFVKNIHILSILAILFMEYVLNKNRITIGKSPPLNGSGARELALTLITSGAKERRRFRHFVT